MAIRQYRCIVSALKIRTQPATAPSFATGQTLKRNQVILADDARRVEADGYLWLNFNLGWCAAHSLDGRNIFMSDGVPQRERMWGINIDPNNPTARPDPQLLRGVQWVRFVYHADSRFEPLERVFAFYDPIIRGYANAGIKILLILLQDTYQGNRPWDNGDWNGYAPGFAERARILASRYRGLVAAYQIWNEGDIRGANTSHYVAPENYAPMLAQASRAITLADPSAQVVFGAVASGSASGIEYIQATRRALGGNLPVDAVSVHPYAHVPPGQNVAPFPNYSGSLDGLMQQFTDAFPQKPIWITEIGVPRVDVNNRDYWPRIANYMDKTVDFLRDTYAYALRNVIWFAWNDTQDQAGIVNQSGAPKNPIFTTYFQNVHSDYPVYEKQESPFTNQVGIVHIAGEPIPDTAHASVARRIAEAAPNVGVLILRGSAGAAWLGGGSLGVSNTGDLSRWAEALSPYRIRLHHWHELHGLNFTGEISLLTQIALAPGVRSLILDLNPATLRLTTSGSVREFMLALRRALPATINIGLSFDGRPEVFSQLPLREFIPFTESWHPRINYRDWNVRPSAAISQMLSVLRPFRRPLNVMAQFGSALDMREAARAALEPELGAGGIAFARLSQADGTALAAVRGAIMPYLAGYPPLPSFGTVRARVPVNIRTVPLQNGEVLGQIAANEVVSILERYSAAPFDWIRHRRGWSVARNIQTGEVFLA
ncbi:MAG: hypothetical protein OHK0023_25100 [Anaerolineae bacterium]